MSEEIAVVAEVCMPPAEMMVWQRDQFAAVKSGLAKAETMKIEGKPYIKRNGWRMVAAGFNVNLELVKDNEGNVLHTRMEGEDELGTYYVHTYTARASLPNGRYAECDGACSSRDAFFSKSHGTRKPQSEIDEADIIATAQTVAYNRAISDLVGGAEVSAEEMLGKDNVSFTPTPTEPEPQPEGETPSPVIRKEEVQRAEIGEMLLEMSGGDVEKGADMLEAATEWENDKGELVRGRRDIRQLTLKQMDVVHRNVEAEYKKWKANA